MATSGRKGLRYCGVPVKIINAIETIYHNSRSVVLVNSNISKELDVRTGVLQGDTLVTFLPTVAIDCVMKNAQKEHIIGKGESHPITSLR